MPLVSTSQLRIIRKSLTDGIKKVNYLVVVLVLVCRPLIRFLRHIIVRLRSM